MNLIYKYSESAIKPVEVEVGKRAVYLRKDIAEEERYDESSETSVTFWTYQEAKLTPEEFAEYSNILLATNAIKGVNDSKNIEGLMIGQENGDNNQLIIMEAIADLYDVIASMR